MPGLRNARGQRESGTHTASRGFARAPGPELELRPIVDCTCQCDVPSRTVKVPLRASRIGRGASTGAE